MRTLKILEQKLEASDAENDSEEKKMQDEIAAWVKA